MSADAWPGASLATDDRLALGQLVGRYAHAVDARDVDGVAVLFAPDGRLEFASTATILQGRDEIRSFFARAFMRPALALNTASTHVMSNTVVTAAGRDNASLLTSAVAYLATAATAEHDDRTTGEVIVRGLTYTDRCVRVDDKWLLAERTHRLHWQATMPGGPVTTDPLD